jgi:hypothetical protein
MVVVTLLVAGPVRAQSGWFPRGLLQGGSLEMFQGLRSPIFTYRATDYRGGTPGIDLGVGMVPATLASGVVVLTPEAGLAAGVEGRPVVLLFRAGASGYLWAGREEARIVPGIQAGAALVVPLDRRSALRFDLSRRHYFDRNGRTRSFWSMGVGFAVLPRDRYDPSGRIADDRAPPSRP